MTDYFFSGIVLSSTNLNRDSCLYARNTTRAIIRKSIILGLSCPILNSVVLPNILGTVQTLYLDFPQAKIIQLEDL